MFRPSQSAHLTNVVDAVALDSGVNLPRRISRRSIGHHPAAPRYTATLALENAASCLAFSRPHVRSSLTSRLPHHYWLSVIIKIYFIKASERIARKEGA